MGDVAGPFFSAIINGLVQGATLFFVAVGLSLIYGVLRVLNVAHGSFYAIGAFTAASAWLLITALHWPSWLIYPALFIVAAVVGIVLGPLLERVFLRWTHTAGTLAEREYLQLLTTYAVFLVLEDVQKLIWGVQPYYSASALRLLGNTQIADIPYTNYQLLLIPLAALLLIALRLFLHRSTAGKSVMAVEEAPEMAAAMGINVGRIQILCFTVGSILAALGGSLSSPSIGVSIGMGADMIALSFAIVAIAGLGQIVGVAVSAVLIGVAHSITVFFWPELSSVVPYIIMVAVLLIRPYGLFGTPEKRRI